MFVEIRQEVCLLMVKVIIKLPMNLIILFLFDFGIT